MWETTQHSRRTNGQIDGGFINVFAKIGFRCEICCFPLPLLLDGINTPDPKGMLDEIGPSVIKFCPPPGLCRFLLLKMSSSFEQQ